MPSVTRVTAPTVQLDPLPGARATSRLDPNFAEPIARGLDTVGEAAVGLMVREQEKADTASLLEAQRRLGDWERAWFDPANPTGASAYRGKQALQLGEKIAPDFDRVATEAAAAIRNPQARLRFQQYAQGKREGVLGRVDSYALKEHDGYVRAEFEGQTTSLAQSAAAAGADGRGADQARDLAQGVQTIRAWGQLQGDPPETTAVRVAAFQDQVHATAITAMLAGRNIDGAARYYDGVKEGLTLEMRARVDAQIQPVLVDRMNKADTLRIWQGALPSSAGVSPDYGAQRRQLESGGDNNAANPRSSALGPDQFLAKTWERLVARHQPAWAHDLTRDQILAARTDPAKSEEMVKHFDQENAEHLSRNGLPVSSQSLYLAHHFGASGAVKIMTADPNTPMSQLVTPEVMEANPYLKGKTVAQMLDNHARRGLQDQPVTGVQAWSGKPTLQDRITLARATIPAERVDDVVRGLREMAAEEEATKRATKAATLEAVWAAVDGSDPSLSPDEIVSSAAGTDALPTHERIAVVDAVRKYQQAKAQGALVQDDPAIVDGYERLLALDPQKFLDAPIRENASKLSGPTMLRLLAQQQAMRDKPAKVAEARSEAEMLQSTFAELGIASGKNGEQRRQLLRDRYYVEAKAAIDAKGGKALTEDEREVIRKRLLLTGARTTPGVLWGENTERRRVFEIAPEEVASYRLEIPPEREAAIKQWLRMRKHPVTDASVRAVYLRTGGAVPTAGGGR